MKFRLFSIFAGIGQAILLFFLFGPVIQILEALNPALGTLEMVSLVFAILALIIALPYPLILKKNGRKADAIAVLLSTAAAIVISVSAVILLTPLTVID